MSLPNGSAFTEKSLRRMGLDRTKLLDVWVLRQNIERNRRERREMRQAWFLIALGTAMFLGALLVPWDFPNW